MARNKTAKEIIKIVKKTSRSTLLRLRDDWGLERVRSLPRGGCGQRPYLYDPEEVRAALARKKAAKVARHAKSRALNVRKKKEAGDTPPPNWAGHGQRENALNVKAEPEKKADPTRWRFYPGNQGAHEGARVWDYTGDRNGMVIT